MPTASETVRRLATEAPDYPAIRLDGYELTYAELDRRADALAARLAEHHPRGARIALQAHGSSAVVQVLLGVRRANMVLVPLDPTAPPARVHQTVADSEAVLLLVENAAAVEAVSPGSAIPVCAFEDFLASESTAAVPTEIEDVGLQLLSYTSGSTGTPKAVMVTEIVTPAVSEAVAEFLPPARRGWAVLSAGSLGASISLLTVGLAFGRTVLPVEVRTVGFATLADLLDAEEAEALIVVPTVLRFWLPGLEPTRHFASLAAVAVFGEAMTGEDHQALAAHVTPDTLVLNAYGTTEAGFVTFLARSAGEQAAPGPLPVGIAADGVELTIVGEDGEPLPAGEPGEIVATSAAAPLGYWKRPELTKDVFTQLADGRRRVRTGDRGWLLPDGSLMLRGRLDHVVKVSGNRVDLGDVEHALRSLPGVQDAAVAARVDELGTTTLHGYVTVLPDVAVHPSVLRAGLARRLPSWMLPLSLAVLPELPRLPNGKVDRRSLPEVPDVITVVDGAGDRQPTGLEAELLALWGQVLKRTDIGLDDDFFALGGDSMKAASVLAHLERRHATAWPVTILLEAPTVSALAVALSGMDDQPVLVPFRTTGEEPALFVIHGGGGEVFFAKLLTEHLETDCPVYGLQPSIPETGDRLREATLEELAAKYVAAILTVQADGPFRLFGYSAGALIGYEMALQLEAAGKKVEVLISGDGPGPGYVDALEIVAGRPTAPFSARPAAGARAVQRFHEVRSAGVRPGGVLVARLARNQVGYRRRQFGRWQARRAQASYLAATGREDTDVRMARVERAVGHLLVDYRPAARAQAPVVLVRVDLAGPDDLGWSGWAADLRIERLASEHGAMVREPDVALLAQHVQLSLGVLTGP